MTGHAEFSGPDGPAPGADAPAGEGAAPGPTTTAPTATATVGPAGPGTAPGDGRRRPWRLSDPRVALLALTALYALAQIAFAVAGVHRNATAADVGYLSQQALPKFILKASMVQSIFYLHSQPPLFNLELGILLHLPYAVQGAVLEVLDLALGLGMVLGAYLLLRELTVPWWLCLAVGAVVAVDPVTALYQYWLYFTYPSGVLVTWAAFFCVRFVRTRRIGWAAGFFASTSVLVLLNSSFELPWLVVALAIVVFWGRMRWRQVAVLGGVALVLVGGWYVKNAVVFGTYTTSSWLGMNLAKITTEPGTSEPRLRQLVHEGEVSRLALVAPFSPLRDYQPILAAEGVHITGRPKGIPALDVAMKNPFTPNLNDYAYITISSLYLKDDLRFIAHDPGRYLRNVGDAVELWFVPADQYAELAQNRAHVSGYATLFDRVVDWQPTSRALVVPQFWKVSAGEMSLRVVLTYLVALAGAPFVAWWERRRRPWVTAGLAFVWLTTVYVFVLSNLLELGENNRFRVDLGVLPTVGALVVVVAVVRRIGERRARAAPPEAAPG